MYAVEAIFDNGVFRPLSPVPAIADQARVVLTVEPALGHNPLATCFGILPESDAEEMKSAIEDAFEGIDLDEWK
jgi:hypothetical protein